LDMRPEGDAIGAIAERLPRYGVTAFCPTTVACGPEALGRVLDQVRRAREAPAARAARVLPAHLESNFINPEYAGAQPSGCLRTPRAALGSGRPGGSSGSGGSRVDRSAKASAERAERPAERPDVTAADILPGSARVAGWSTDHRRRVDGAPRGRDNRGQRADHGSGVPDAGRPRGSLAG